MYALIVLRFYEDQLNCNCRTTAGACVRARSWSDLFATLERDQGGGSGMHDSIPAGASIVDPVGCIIQDACLAFMYVCGRQSALSFK